MRQRPVVVVTLCCLALLTPAGGGGAAEPARKGYAGMKIEGEPNGPVVINEVLPGSPAAKVGLRTGDVLVKVGNVQAKDVNTVIDTVTSFMPGDKITVEFTRDGQARSLIVTLEERPKDLPDR